jgi:hypothetical protein
MRLTSLHEAYWQPIADHPGQLGKLDKRAKKNDKSFLVHPEDRKRWLKWFGGGKKIKEDLDDKDTFAPSCDTCARHTELINDHCSKIGIEPPDDPEYHDIHTIAATTARNEHHKEQAFDDWEAYGNVYERIMKEHGYVGVENGWIPKSIIQTPLLPRKRESSGRRGYRNPGF